MARKLVDIRVDWTDDRKIDGGEIERWLVFSQLDPC